MTLPQLRAFYVQRRAHMLGRAKSVEWAAKQATIPPGGNSIGVAYCFWYSKTGSRELDWVAVRGLESAVERGGFDKVVLLTYQDFNNVPDGVTVESAAPCTELCRFKRLLKQGEKTLDGFIAPLSDFIRLSACLGSVADASWLVDVDTLWRERCE